MLLKQGENLDKRNILYTNENSFEKRKIEQGKNSNRKIDIEIKRLSDIFFLKKYEKLLLKNHKTYKNKSLNTLNSYMPNNSKLNLHNNKLGSYLCQNFLKTDRPLYKKLNNKGKLNQNILTTKIKNSKTMKMRPDINKKLSIECGYFSNEEKYDISGDKYSQRYKNYLSSLPSTKRKINNTSSCTKKDKKIFISSKNAFIKLNDSYHSKYQYQAKQKLNKNKLNNKIMIDDYSGNMIFPNSTQAIQDDSISYNLETNRRLNSDLNSFDNKTKEDNNSNYSKIVDLKRKNPKAHGKIFIKKDNILKSIKVNKNNNLEKTNKNCLNNLLNNEKIIKIHPYLKTNNNINSNNKITTLKKIDKNKSRLKSCKFTNEQIQKFEKELITESNIKFKKLAEKAYKKSSNFKINQSSSIIDKKNITFFSNYIKDNKIYINSHINSNGFYTNCNLSSYINSNESAIIRNNTNINFMKNYNNLLTTNKSKKKKKSFLYKKSMLREDDLLKKIRIKIKSKALTTLNSKENSKTNIFYDSIINTSINKSSKNNNYINSNLNNKNNNDKKIFINNIINVNNTNENNNIENNIMTNNNKCYSYRFGGDKIKFFKNKIIEVSSNQQGLDYSYTNQSQRILNQNKMGKVKLQLRDIILNNNKIKKENKAKNPKSNIIKKNNIIKYKKISNKNIKLDKDSLLNKDKKIPESIHKKFESSEIYIHKPHSNNLSNKSNIFPEINQELISNNFSTDKNEAKNNKENNKTTSVASTLKECEYYKQECNKLVLYIKDYFKNNNDYPKTTLNFYKIGRILGKGAFGKVNIALHLASGRLVAIKSFNKKKLTTRRAKRKIKTEIEVLSKLRNPFCTQIYDYFETDTHILIVMEYICGDLLGFMRKRSKITESTAKIIFKQIIKGLQYIHKKKIVHRDIKLDNVLIDLTNTVKICDFGVSRILQPGDTMYEHCGTPAYIAPEIFRNEGYEGYSCDIWSAGVTLYYMLAGMQPFKGGKIEELKGIILKGEYEQIKDISNEANDLINRMLKLNPKERITIEEILKHPWLKNVDIKNRQKLNLFTNAEKGLLAKYDVNYLTSPKEELIEVFTVSNLQTKDEKESKGATKSDILAPYNSYANKLDEDIYPELKIENDICRFNFKAQLSNIKYELSNNQEFDNGIIKTMYNSVENDICISNNNKTKTNKETTQSLNHSLDSIETFTFGLCDDVIKDIEELIGYNKKYLVQCLRNNEINYATATYYLMLKDELNSN